MATFQAIWQPKSKTGGINDSQCATLIATTNQSFTVGVRQKLFITLTATASIRFSLGANTAAVSDFTLPSGASPGGYFFETGDEYDTVSFISAGTPTVCVMRLSV